jgi:hypothetical protein
VTAAAVCAVGWNTVAVFRNLADAQRPANAVPKTRSQNPLVTPKLQGWRA